MVSTSTFRLLRGMVGRMVWLAAERIESARLLLEPLRIDHAEPMVAVLADPALYRYTGGEPPSLDELRRRYAAQVTGHSGDGAQGWLNWVITLAGSQESIGYVQATLERSGTRLDAEIAWVIGSKHQGTGLGSEAATTMVRWLRTYGVDHLVAHVHPDHGASAGVARKLGLSPTGVIEDGETRWQS